MTAEKLVNVECICNPDVHLGDGRVLTGPQREGTKVVVPGQVSAVTRELADLLLENGQVKETARESTVFVEDTSEYKVAQVEALIAKRRAEEGGHLTATQLVDAIRSMSK